MENYEIIIISIKIEKINKQEKRRKKTTQKIIKDIKRRIPNSHK